MRPLRASFCAARTRRALLSPISCHLDSVIFMVGERFYGYASPYLDVRAFKLSTRPRQASLAVAVAALVAASPSLVAAAPPILAPAPGSGRSRVPPPPPAQTTARAAVAATFTAAAAAAAAHAIAAERLGLQPAAIALPSPPRSSPPP